MLTYFLNGTRGFNSPAILPQPVATIPIRALPRVPPPFSHTPGDLLIIAGLNLAHDYFKRYFEPEED